MKKTITLITFIGLTITPAFALAGSPVIDPTVTGTTAATTATSSITTAQQILKTLKDYGLDTIAYTLAQKLGQKMATMAINKATGGASSDKDPNYIKDFSGVMSKIEQQQLDLFTTSLTMSGNPFAKDIAKNMLTITPGDAIPKFTLGDTLQNPGDWKAAASDISVAGDHGWDYYAQLAMPQNTPIGSSMLAQDALAKQIANKKTTETLKLTSSGFLPNAKCTKTVADFKNIANSANAANNQLYNTPEQAQAALQQQTQQQNGQINGAVQDTAGCIDEIIKNPVATTQTLTNEAGKFGMDMTKNIQGWGQIVAGLFVSLFNGFVDKGLGALKADYGQVKPSNTGGPEQLTQTSANGTQTINFANAPYNIVDMRNDFEAALVGTQKNIDTLKKLQTSLMLVPSRLATLDMCLPGPDIIGLDKRLNAYYDQQTGWIQKSSMMGDDKKRNTYQEFILAMLDRDYGIAKSEMSQAMNDDTQNIPGSGNMRAMINSFAKKKNQFQSASNDLITASTALSSLRSINTSLKGTVTNLKQTEPGFTNLPGLVFTSEEWAGLDQATKDSIYQWLKTHGTPPTTTITGDAIRDYVIKSSWDLWETPTGFLPNHKWTDEDAGGASATADNFLIEKNKVRAAFSSTKESVPTDWEISKNEQQLAANEGDITKTDQMIHDCDQMRHLIWGDSNGVAAPYAGKTSAAMIADMVQNKDTYFQSSEIKDSLTLPNILNTSRSWEEDQCRPDSTINYQAPDSSGHHFGAHTPGPGGVDYVCVGNFGHTIDSVEAESSAYDANKWIDDGSNIYQANQHIQWPSELWLGSRILKFIPPPNPDPYGKGWTTQLISGWTTEGNGWGERPDKGGARLLFCKLNSLQADYGKRSGADIDHESKGLFCSSKWADVSNAEAVGSFLIDSLY